MDPPKDSPNKKKDVMEVIERLQDDGKKNKHMEGYISKNLIEDSFAMNEENKVPDSSLAINCADHNRPAVFFS